MRLKHLEAALSSITREFPSPKVALEQYPTSAHLAASVIQLALDKGDLGEDKVCLDLGCGTGMLTVGAAFVSPLVISVDCDLEAMAVARENVESVDLSDSVLFVQAQVRTLAAPKSKSTTRGNGGRTARGRGRASTGSGRSSRG
jgi:predicted RNA methylase